MPFTERSQENWSEERERLLHQRICELGLKIEGTRLEGLVQRLYQDLDAAGIELKPRVYLADEWGCPEGVPTQARTAVGQCRGIRCLSVSQDLVCSVAVSWSQFFGQGDK